MKNCKNFWKRGISLALALMMCLSLLPVNAFAADAHEHVHTTLASENCQHEKAETRSKGNWLAWRLEYKYCPECNKSCWCIVGRISGYIYYEGDWVDGDDPGEVPDLECKHQDTELRGAVEATCTEKGYTGDTWCKDCGNKIATGHETAVDPDNHVHTEVRDAVTATCQAGGYTGDTYCNDCGNLIEEGEETQVDPNNHDGETEVRGAVTATCTEAGYTGDTYCLGCDTKIADGEEIAIDADAHDWDNGEVTTKPTCTEKGVKTFTCTRDASHTRTEEIEIDPNAHDWGPWHKDGNKIVSVCAHNDKHVQEWTGEDFPEDHTCDSSVDVPEVPATCTATGTTAGKKCSICGKVMSGCETIEKLNHDWSDWTITKAPTATTKGEAKHDCKRDDCNASETKVLPALTDSTVWTLASSKVATCMENGQEVYTSEYGPVTVTIEKDSNNHDAACTVGGWVQNETQHWHVRTCGAIVDTGDHTWTDVKYVDGKYSYECATCGYQVTGADEVPASHEHKFTTSDPGRDAYCAHVSFTQHWECSCGLGWDEVNEGGIKSLDAVRTAPVTATCVADGNIEYWTCQDCGKHFSDAACTVEVSDVITKDPDNHAYGDWTITTAPTANTDGLATRVCGNDETHIDTKVLPALNDLPAAEGWTKDDSQHVDAGCETAGQDVYVNAELDLELTVVIPELGHDWGDWNVTTAPTADAEGEATRTCGRCGDKETKTLPALGGNGGGEGAGSEWTYAVTVEPGCTTDGVGTYTYTEDGSTVTVTIPATGHAWGDWTVALEPTYAAEGLEIRTCANCGETQTRVISALELPAGGLGGDTEEPEILIEDEQTPLAGMPFALNPEDELTRGHLMYVLHWFDGEPEAEVSTFIDVAFEAYYSTAIGWAQDENIARGTPDNKFMPEDTVTRGQMEVFLTRYAEYLGLDMEVVLVGDDSDLMFWAEAETILNEFFANLPVEA